MSTKLNFISAGAGSGKTHRLTHILHTELSARRIDPSGVIATTFTRKAATELRERVRGFLLEQGEYRLANAMGQARIGTVNAVCGDLLSRFAFEAGLPTQQTVLEEEQSTILLRQAIDLVQDSAEAAQLGNLRERLSIEDWDADFKNLVATVRANDISPQELSTIAQENADDLLSHFPVPTEDNLTSELVAALDKAIPLIQASAGTVKLTATYLEAAETLRRGLRYGDARWSDWIKLSKLGPASALKELALPVQAVAQRVVYHAGLHNDLREYLAKQFDLAARVLEEYAKIKRERGVIDFTDQERLLLKLMDDPYVAQTLSDELQLLMVDEFQDTSPIQLALFLKLTKFAKQVYWVGDIKQAIYGFRGSDTELMESILNELEALGGNKDRLSHSWRSRKPLVDLVNAVFIPAFGPTMTPENIALIAKREEIMDGAPFANWGLPGNAEQQISALGNALRQLIASGYTVYDKQAKQLRRAKLSDIAILRRSNDSVTTTANELRNVGVPAMTAQPGLLETPEAVLALACLRRLNDPRDTLASAEIISLSDCTDPEVWVSDRFRHLSSGEAKTEWRETGANAHPILARLARLRKDVSLMTPTEALEMAIAQSDLPRLVLQWNASADVGRVRLANLDAVISMARQYETVCAGANHAASVSGLLLWFEEQAHGESDNKALPAIDAVQVMTHHKSKGLEWPIVVLMDTHAEIKDSMWNSLRAKSRNPISAADPLRERTLRLWPWPFGKQQKFPFADEISRSPIALKFQKIAIEEAKRLLYVSMTRARDLMIFAMPEKKQTGPWLETLNAPWLSTPDQANEITLPDGQVITLLPFPELQEKEIPEHREQLNWYKSSTIAQPRLSRTFNPSKAESPAMVVTKTLSLGERMHIAGKVDWATVGHAVHGALALAFVDPKRPIKTEDVERLLKKFDLSSNISAKSLTEQVHAIVQWVGNQWPSCGAFPEWPVHAVLPSQQILNGRVDLLIDAGSHWVLIDHKSNPGARSSWPELANTYGGQLMSYKAAIELATSKPVKELWMCLPVSGAAVQIEPAAH